MRSYLIVGNLILCLGGSLAAVNFFKQNLFATYAGFLTFFIGFRVMQFGKYDSWNELSLNRKAVKEYSIIAVAIFLISLGFIMGVEAVKTLNFLYLILCGPLFFIGYSLAHAVENGVLL